MKKQIYLVILTVITVLCIIVGSAYHLFGWMGNSFGNIFGSLDHSRVTYSEDLDNLKEIRLECSVMDVTIKTGGSFHLSYDCVAYLVPEIRVTDGALILEQPAVPHFGGFNNRCSMTLTVPSQTVLSNSAITVDVGDIRLTDTAFDQKSTITLDVGDIRIKNCTFADAELGNDVGDIRLEDSSLRTSKISANIGDVKLTDCTFGFLDVSNDIGDISVDSGEDLSGYPMEFSCDAGSVTVNGRNHKRHFSQDGSLPDSGIELENNVGDITVKYQ